MISNPPSKSIPQPALIFASVSVKKSCRLRALQYIPRGKVAIYHLKIIISIQRTSLHKGVLVLPEYLNNILAAYNHIKRTCTGGKFELNGLLVW